MCANEVCLPAVRGRVGRGREPVMYGVGASHGSHETVLNLLHTQIIHGVRL